MRLADFITRESDAILAQWETFAATCLPAARQMTTEELRDHARQILEVIAEDLRTPQTEEEQAAKSKGLVQRLYPAVQTAAEVHATLRAKSGFDIRQLAGEYRALRASVLALWLKVFPPDGDALTDIIRFNEAIDQALAESVDHFSQQVEQSRALLLGVMSHDMGNPLLAIQMTAQHLARINAGDEVAEVARRLIRSGERLQRLLNDLVDFNRVHLGLGIQAIKSAVDLGQLCAEEVEEIGTAYPGARIELSVVGDCRGRWDPQRMHQLVSNLVANAVKYGEPAHGVRVTVTAEEGTVGIEVSNRSSTLDPTELSQIFEPLKRRAIHSGHPGLGLGLYIVREIAKAHNGTASASYRAGEVVFTVCLPR